MSEGKGTDGSIAVEGDDVVLTFSGMLAHLDKKAVSPRRIPLSAVAKVEFVAPKGMKSGYLRLRLAGEPEQSSLKPAQDPNAVLCNPGKSEKALRVMAEALEPLIAGAGATPVRLVSAQDVAELKQQGKQQEKLAKAEAEGLREDIARAKSRMSWTLGGGREIKKLEEHLYEGERVELIAQGTYGENQGIVVMTSSRLLFLFHGIVRQSLEDFPYKSISSVQSSSGAATGALTVHASGNRAVISAISKPDLKTLVDALRMRLGEGSQVSSSAAPPAAPDVMDQLRKLGELREAGILTPEEFDAKKTELLSRL